MSSNLSGIAKQSQRNRVRRRQASCIFLRFYEPASKPLAFTVTLFAQGSESSSDA